MPPHPKTAAVYRLQVKTHDVGWWDLPSIPDDADAALKDRIAARNVAAHTGECPGCGCEAELAGPIRPGHDNHIYFVHDVDCPAVESGES